MSAQDLRALYRSGSWEEALGLAKFERLLSELGLGGLGIGKPLFEAFDQDGNGQLDSKELFIGMALLLSSSQAERLECAFMMMDTNGSGRVSRDEVSTFLHTIAARPTNQYDVELLASQIMKQVLTLSPPPQSIKVPGLTLNITLTLNRSSSPSQA